MKIKQSFCRHRQMKILDQHLVEGNIIIIRYFCPKCGTVFAREYDFK